MNLFSRQDRKGSSSRRGFTLVEVLVGSGMLVALAVAWGQFVRGFSRTAKQGRVDVQLTKEHKALIGTMSTIPRHAVLLQNCVFLNPPPIPGDPPGLKGESPAANYPGGPPQFRTHPYRYVVPNTGNCQSRSTPVSPNGSNAPLPAPQYITFTRALYDAIWEWPNQGAPLYSAVPGPAPLPNFALDANWLNTQIIPLVAPAGCLNCHNGIGGRAGDPPRVPPWILPCDFSIAAHWTGGCGTVFAHRNMITSRLGQLFLPHETLSANAWRSMNRFYTNFLVNRQARILGVNVSGFGSPIQSFIRFELQNVALTAGGIGRTFPPTYCGTVCPPTAASCGGPPCPPTYVVDPASCTVDCRGKNMDTALCPCGKDCWQSCLPQCLPGFFLAEFTCVTNTPGTVNPVPRISLSTGTISVVGGGAAQKVLSNAVVPP